MKDNPATDMFIEIVFKRMRSLGTPLNKAQEDELAKMINAFVESFGNTIRSIYKAK